jgi:hypothetical protein
MIYCSNQYITLKSMNDLSFYSKMLDIGTTWIQEAVIYDYFLKLNQGDFSGVCQLFTEGGCLYAPLKGGICGRKAIYDYLQLEAREMIAVPQSGFVESSPDGCSKYHLRGKVQTRLFTVNVGWTIELNDKKEIVTVIVTLLAELQELFGLQNQTSGS